MRRPLSSGPCLAHFEAVGMELPAPDGPRPGAERREDPAVEATALAENLKKTQNERRTIVFIDKSGLSERPHRCRTRGPKVRNFGQFSVHARRALCGMRRRPTLVCAFWEQAELQAWFRLACPGPDRTIPKPLRNVLQRMISGEQSQSCDRRHPWQPAGCTSPERESSSAILLTPASQP